MNGVRLRAVARKEILHILRDPRSLIMALALPVVMMGLFGWALTLDVDRIPLVVLDQGKGPAARDLISRFSGSRFFELIGRVESYRDLELEIDRGSAIAALILPPDFDRSLARGETSSVQFILDGSDSNTASIALGYASSILEEESRKLAEAAARSRFGRAPERPVQLEPRVRYNPQLESKNYIVPGLIAVILMIIASLLTSLTIAREWEMGTMEQLLSTPVRPAELVLGKMSAYFLVAVADTVLAITLGVFVFGVPLRGNLALLAVSCLVFICGALFWGVFLSALVRTQLLAYMLGMISSFLPAFLLSGFIFAIKNMPVPVQVFTYIVPARYFIALLRGVFLKGSGPELVAGELGLLTLYAVAVFLLATWRLKGKVA